MSDLGSTTMYERICRVGRLALALLGLVMVVPAYAQTVPGQTNQDIDLFLVNPTVAADRPNVLIVWDNTANWGQQVSSQTAYSIERQALSQVVAALNDD